VPGAQIVGVVAFLWIARSGAEVAEVARSARRIVLVVAYAGHGACLVASPGGAVAALERGARPVFVDVVAEGSDRAVDAVEQAGRRLVAGSAAGGDVPRPDQDRVASRPAA
jgi:hypothetical protein